jgi:hypothetical protein
MEAVTVSAVSTREARYRRSGMKGRRSRPSRRRSTPARSRKRRPSRRASSSSTAREPRSTALPQTVHHRALHLLAAPAPGNRGLRQCGQHRPCGEYQARARQRCTSVAPAQAHASRLPRWAVGRQWIALTRDGSQEADLRPSLPPDPYGEPAGWPVRCSVGLVSPMWLGSARPRYMSVIGRPCWTRSSGVSGWPSTSREMVSLNRKASHQTQRGISIVNRINGQSPCANSPLPKKREPTRGLTYPARAGTVAAGSGPQGRRPGSQAGGKPDSLDLVGDARSGDRPRRPTTSASRRASWRQLGQLSQ